MRKSGILLPISSLPSPYGIGCFSREAYEFADQLVKAGQTYWQILPLGPTGYGDSPYQSFSAFAGNPYFIDLEELVREGMLTKADLEGPDFGTDPERVDYGKIYRHRLTVLYRAFQNRSCWAGADYDAFCEKQKDWLDDYCLYRAIKSHFHEKSWAQWDSCVKMRDQTALSFFREKCADEIAFHKFMQYEFMRQWKRLKGYANDCGIKIIGDIPIYVAFDGADAWSGPELFLFDKNREPIGVAGCPPDAFSADGQLWGNPLYNWDYHEKTGYAWWIRRLSRCYELYDVVRVDHFRGFDEYYAIPADSETAAAGSWKKGPGMKLFNALKAHFGKTPIIAEDLGYLTDSVRELVRESGYPGMKLIEFAFDSREPGDYMPYTYPRNSVVYTGTHDNQTLAAWYDELAPQDRKTLQDFLQLDGETTEQIVWQIIALTMGCVSDTAIIPMQDYLCLGAQARMNKPSTMGHNWQWRMRPGAFTDHLAQRIRDLTKATGRLEK